MLCSLMMIYSFLMKILVNEIGILDLDLDKIYLNDDNNFDEDDPKTILYVRLLAWCNKLEKCEALKKYISI